MDSESCLNTGRLKNVLPPPPPRFYVSADMVAMEIQELFDNSHRELRFEVFLEVSYGTIFDSG